MSRDFAGSTASVGISDAYSWGYLQHRKSGLGRLNSSSPEWDRDQWSAARFRNRNRLRLREAVRRPVPAARVARFVRMTHGLAELALSGCERALALFASVGMKNNAH